MPHIQWNSNLYNDKHDFVSMYGADVIEWLQPKGGERVLDVGCGTGTLANEIGGFGASITGIDASAEMIAKAKESFPQIDFTVADATNFQFAETFDAVFSNATLHWINEQEKALQCIYNCLRHEGRFVFEMGGKHNIQNIHNAVVKAITNAGFENAIPANTNYFPSVAEQCFLLEKVGFTVSQVSNFKRPTVLKGEDGMKNWINQFCGFFFTNIPQNKIDSIKDNAVEIARTTNYKDGIWYGDYVRLRVKASKEIRN